MCGIFALIETLNNTPNTITDTKFNKYVSISSKRGPEQKITQILFDQSIFIFYRLAINGLNEESNQPFGIYTNNNYIVSMCNGEIYNHNVLKNNYHLPCNSGCDCEVIPYIYEKEGPDRCAKLLNGAFAFILYDRSNNMFFIARDPYGVRPLYICLLKNGSFVFCSDLESVLFNQPSILSIGQFKPGHYMTLRYSEKNSTYMINEYVKYFNFRPIIKNIMTHEHYLFQLLTRLQNAIKIRVNCCERDIACLLSGGLDSSIITAYVNRYHNQKMQYLPEEDKYELKTYSIGITEDAPDLHYANMVASHLNIEKNHNVLIYDYSDFISVIPNVIRDIESFDTTTVRASVGNWLIGKYISESGKEKVIFNGDGSDELMGGYMYFHYCPDNNEFDNECKRLLTNISKYDVLRSDKSISSHGLEPRSPFLDEEFTLYYLSIPSEVRNHNVNNKMEKYLIREAIEMFDPELLPKEVLWRPKEAFSDGISKQELSWHDYLRDYMNTNDIVTKILNDKNIIYPDRVETNEQKYYYFLFNRIFSSKMDNIIPEYWMPKYVQNVSDPSARVLDSAPNKHNYVPGGFISSYLDNK